MIQNNLLSSQTKFNQNQIKNTKLKRFAIGQLQLFGPEGQRIALVI